MFPSPPRTPLDPDRDTARDLLQGELNTPDYNRPESFVEQVLTWVEERIMALLGIIEGEGSLANLLITLVVLAVVVVAVLALRGRRRGLVLRQHRGGAVIEDPALTAADYRARAAEAAARGDWDTVLLDSYRAMTVDAARRTVLEDVPSLTAHEIGMQLSRAFPGHEAALAALSDAFDGVRYGGTSAERDQAVRAQALDRTLSRTTPHVEALA